MSETYFLDPSFTSNQFVYPTQATAFGTSSLASASGSFLALDTGSQIQKLYPMSPGNSMRHNMNIVDTDKSVLGVMARTKQLEVGFAPKKVGALTTPNKFSLSRDSLL